MAAPRYVPSAYQADQEAPVYRSPPRRPGSWTAERPGEVIGAVEPVSGPSLGCQGPDQGFALKLARRFADKLVLEPGERADDVLAGCCAVALRRASLFGRAPVTHDLRLALELFGFLGACDAGGGLAAWRGGQFAGAAGHHGYLSRRRLAELVPDQTLRATPSAVAAARAADWRRPLGLDDPIT